MPLTGTMDVAPLVDSAPLIPDLKTGAEEFKGATILQVMYEIEDTHMEAMLPKALHPTIPPTVVFLFYSCPGSSLGSFTLAQVRVGCRAGVRPRGYLVKAYVDNETAGKALSERWGYRCETADVSLRKFYDRAVGTVSAGGNMLLDVSLIDPEAISGGDIQYTANMNLARVERDGQVVPRLVQVDPEAVFHKAERGRPHLSAFDAQAWGEARVVPTHAVSASYTLCDLTLTGLRYLCDPDVLTMQGTERL
jgi:hypothetical protein